MCWNDGYERKRFEEKLKKQREEYKKHGMSDAKIEEIEKKDWEIYRSDRRFYSHTQPLEIDDDFENENSQLVLYLCLKNALKLKYAKFVGCQSMQCIGV